MKFLLILLIIIINCCNCFELNNNNNNNNNNTTKKVTVEGIALRFTTTDPIPNANIYVKGKGLTYKTDKNGKFVIKNVFHVGEEVTLLITKDKYHKTQGPTVTLTGDLIGNNAYVLQVPLKIVYGIFAMALGHIPRSSKCQMVVTVTAYNKTLFDHPQGEPGATVEVYPNPGVQPIYLGWKNGHTDPLEHGLKATSLDGGVVWMNATPRDTPYKIVAKKDGKVFSTSHLWCRADHLVNAAPPQSPCVMNG